MINNWSALVSRYPLLQHDGPRGNGSVRFCQFDKDIANEFASHSYVIPFVSEQECLVTQRQNGKWVLPGGTLEPGETWLDAAHRELMEEAGAQLLELAPFGLYDCLSNRKQPDRSHLPHPRNVRVVSFANARIVAPAADPDNEAGIGMVRILSVYEVAKLFTGENADFGSLYLLAHELRQLQY